jgi:hypothetical protein
MRDRGVIYFGLAGFLALATFPLWRNVATAPTARGPSDVLPLKAKQCVAPVEYMRTSHMTLLMNWRDQVVRQGIRDYAAFDGQHYTMSLTSTCLKQCHSVGKAEFCDRCHNYEAVSLPCWDCHEDSKVAAGRVP